MFLLGYPDSIPAGPNHRLGFPVSTALVTGGNRGLGLETARQLAPAACASS